ncbi:hypothetical protein BsWGS_17222 [Bradybaena similaris]
MFATWPLSHTTQDPMPYNVEELLGNATNIEVYPLFQFWADPFNVDVNFTTKLIIRGLALLPPVLGFPLHDYAAFSKQPEYRNLYCRRIYDYSRFFRFENTATAWEEAMAIVQAEETLADIYINFMSPNPEVLTLSQLDADYGQLMNWTNFVKNLAALPGVGITDISENETVAIININAFNESIKYFLNLSESTQKNLIIWRTIDSLLSAIIKPEDKLRIVLESFTMEQTDPDPFRDEPCALFVSRAFHLVIHRMLYEEHLPKEKLQTLADILDRMKTQFLAILDEHHWIDDITVQFINDKIEEISTVESHYYESLDETNLDNHYSDVHLDGNNFIANIVAIKKHLFDKSFLKLRHYSRFEDQFLPHEQVAFHLLVFHAIHYTSFLLQKPWFVDDAVMANNYASFGFFIAHEIIHAFDVVGIYYHANGTADMWLKDAVMTDFYNRVQCFKDQYNNYFYKTVGGFVNGELTIQENLADNGAVNVAYRAFMNYTKTVTPREADLPGVGKEYEKLFFLKIARVWCLKETKLKGYASIVDVHPPPEIRINGAFRNSPDFAKAFNCPLGSYMNPADKCRLW